MGHYIYTLVQSGTASCILGHRKSEFRSIIGLFPIMCHTVLVVKRAVVPMASLVPSIPALLNTLCSLKHVYSKSMSAMWYRLFMILY